MSGAGEVSIAPGPDGDPPLPPHRKLRVGRRGRDGPSDEEVASHQRARLYDAMARAVADHGYEATTVRELSALAGVSTRTVYQLFADGKRECFLSAYDTAMRRMARRMALAYISERDRERGLARALEAFAREVCEEPQAARLVLVEVFAAGPAALERMEHTRRLFGGMVDLSFRAATGGRPPPPPWMVKGIVAGVARVARVRLLDGRTAELPELTGDLLEWTLSYRSAAAATLEKLQNGQVACGAVSAGPGERGDDRMQILDAVARLAAENGYATLTTKSIAVAAGVSRRRLHAHFQDVQECFIAALEHHTEQAHAHAASAAAKAQSWPGGLYRALTALCAYIAADPVFARMGFVEVFAPPEGLRCRACVITRVAESFRDSAPTAERPSELAAEASVGAVWGLVQHQVANGGARLLPGIAGILSFLMLAPAIGAQQAVEAIAAEQARYAREQGRGAGRARCGSGSDREDQARRDQHPAGRSLAET